MGLLRKKVMSFLREKIMFFLGEEVMSFLMGGMSMGIHSQGR